MKELIATQTLVICIPLPYDKPIFWIALYVILSYIGVGLAMRASDRVKGDKSLFMKIWEPDLCFFCVSPLFFPFVLFMIFALIISKIFLLPYRILVGRWD